MSASAHRRGGRRWLAIAVSLALHLFVFWLLLRHTTTALAPARPPIVIALRESAPARSAPAKSGPEKSPPTKSPSRSAATAAGPKALNAPTGEAPEASIFARRQVSPGARGMLIVPWGDHGGHTDHVDPQRADPAADNARVAQRLAEENEAFQAQLDTETGARGTVADLKHAIAANFAPQAEWVQNIPRSQAAKDQKTRHFNDAIHRPQATSEGDRAQTPGSRQLAQQMGLPAILDACAASHEIGRLEARVRVNHDASGQGKDAHLVRSSGSEVYDKYAEDTVLAASARALTSMRGEAVPIYSEWSLAQVVYDWYSTAALGCPPSGRPPGRPVDPNARDPWGITFTNDITLAAVRYAHAGPATKP